MLQIKTWLQVLYNKILRKINNNIWSVVVQIKSVLVHNQTKCAKCKETKCNIEMCDCSLFNFFSYFVYLFIFSKWENKRDRLSKV
jgi:hypothetical protein